MKRSINKIVVLLVAVFALGACSKDFLNEPAPSGSVSEDVVFNSRAGVEAYISGIHRRARGQWTTGHDAGGINSMYYARVVKGNDIIQANTWFSFDYDQDNREPTYRRTVFSWEFPYAMINQANTLINGINASEALSEEDKAELLGQGLALRAFYYFQLAQEFQASYTVNPNAPAPPIYLELSLEGHPMTTLQEMYDLIVSDLTTAIAGLDESRLDKSYINVDVAHGILARVYQVMGNWAGAEEHAVAAYGGDVDAALAPEEYQNGFNDMGDTEWLWAMPQYEDQTMYYFSAPHAQSDHYNLGYYGTFVNAKFVEKFSATDVRNTFENGYGAPVGHWQEFITNKFSFATFGVDFPIMRTAEMILIEAEANYWQGDLATAHDLLYQLQVNRDPQAVKSSNTGEALLEEILLERRKELYGEIGVEWFDARRLERGITRSSNHRIVKNLEPNDKRFFLKIPQSEIDANDAIDASVNDGR